MVNIIRFEPILKKYFHMFRLVSVENPAWFVLDVHQHQLQRVYSF